MEPDVGREELKCHVVRLEYNFAARTGRLDMAESACCDRDGCVALFEWIDPGVQLIHTYSGNTPDAQFEKINGEWFSFDEMGCAW